MRRLPAVLVATVALLVATPASACLPPHISFVPGSIRLDHGDLKEIRDILEGYRPGSPQRFLLRADGREAGSASYNRGLARRRAEVVRAALVRRGVPARHIAVDAASLAVAGTGPQRGFPPTIWIEMLNASSGCVG